MGKIVGITYKKPEEKTAEQVKVTEQPKPEEKTAEPKTKDK